MASSVKQDIISINCPDMPGDVIDLSCSKKYHNKLLRNKSISKNIILDVVTQCRQVFDPRNPRILGFRLFSS